MKIKYTKEEFDKAKSNDKLKVECCECGENFLKEKKHIKHEIKSNKGEIKFCSQKCHYENRNTIIELSCVYCDSKVLKKPYELRKNKTTNIFCSSSCAAKYNNTHKSTGTRRSKLEAWIEDELKKEFSFEIIFNGKEAINSELDIYIPSLNLAFELNGIFHYEPIYGDKKLESVKNNDDRKFQACLESKIEFCTIDVSSSKHFKPERDKKYLDIIKNIITMNRNNVYQQQQQINQTD